MRFAAAFKLIYFEGRINGIFHEAFAISWLLTTGQFADTYVWQGVIVATVTVSLAFVWQKITVPALGKVAVIHDM